jgi:DNA polymerase-3 subunit chi
MGTTTRVDFYLVDAPGAEALVRLLCKVVEKAYRQGRRIFVRAASPAQARLLDDRLWTFRDRSFVPHALMGEAGDPVPPVLLGTPGSEPPEDTDVLVNLDREVPEGFARFPRVVELVDPSDGPRQAARERFRAYREAGCEPSTHDMRGAQGGR